MRRQAWIEYFACEKIFYDWLAKDYVTTSLHGGERTYVEQECLITDVMLDTPPRYIRHIAVLHDNCIAEFHQRFAELKALHKIAVTSIKKPNQQLPFRTPILINDHIEHISISVKEAFKSQHLKKGENIIWSIIPDDENETRELVQKIEKAGMRCFLEPEDRPHLITTPFEDFAAFVGTDNIQARFSTGAQYTARLRKKGESSSKPMRYGYILLKQRADIVEANKQAKRPHVMDRKWRKIELPFDVARSFYDLNAPL